MSLLVKRLAAASLLLWASVAQADWEVGAGLGDEIFGESPVTAQVSYVFGERFEHVLGIGAITERQAGPREVSPDTVFLSYVTRIPIKRFYLGLGVVVVSDTSEVISSTGAFTQTLGWRITDRWLLEARHISNAGLEGRNIGENLFTLIYRFD